MRRLRQPRSNRRRSSRHYSRDVGLDPRQQRSHKIWVDVGSIPKLRLLGSQVVGLTPAGLPDGGCWGRRRRLGLTDEVAGGGRVAGPRRVGGGGCLQRLGSRQRMQLQGRQRRPGSRRRAGRCGDWGQGGGWDRRPSSGGVCEEERVGCLLVCGGTRGIVG